MLTDTVKRSILEGTDAPFLVRKDGKLFTKIDRIQVLIGPKIDTTKNRTVDIKMFNGPTLVSIQEIGPFRIGDELNIDGFEALSEVKIFSGCGA